MIEKGTVIAATKSKPPCVHSWRFQGSRHCPYDVSEDRCSQPVYGCQKYGAVGYGGEGGPGHEACLQGDGERWIFVGLNGKERRAKVSCPLRRPTRGERK